MTTRQSIAESPKHYSRFLSLSGVLWSKLSVGLAFRLILGSPTGCGFNGGVPQSPHYRFQPKLRWAQ